MDDPVLVLNANFEPIHVCDIRRALGLIMAERASLVMNGRGEMKSVSAFFPRPSIIRLKQMIHRPRPTVRLSRREIFRRDGYTCQYCGKHTFDLTIDHVVPRHLGGPHTWTNVVAACSACNHHKGGRPLTDTNIKLRHLPVEPPNSAYYIFGRHLKDYIEWEPFLAGW